MITSTGNYYSQSQKIHPTENMAKPKKYPKSPKSNASLKVWENHKNKCLAIDKHNAAIKADKAKKESIRKSVATIKSKR